MPSFNPYAPAAYDKNETYTKNEVYNKSEVYSKTEAVAKADVVNDLTIDDATGEKPAGQHEVFELSSKFESHSAGNITVDSNNMYDTGLSTNNYAMLSAWITSNNGYTIVGVQRNSKWYLKDVSGASIAGMYIRYITMKL